MSEFQRELNKVKDKFISILFTVNVIVAAIVIIGHIITGENEQFLAVVFAIYFVFIVIMYFVMKIVLKMKLLKQILKSKK